MDVVVFSDTKNIETYFEKIKKSRSMSLRIHSVGDLKKTIKTTTPSSVVYLDFTGIKGPSIKKQLSFLKSSNRVFGVLMPRENHSDPAMFIHEGASDYMGKVLLKDGVTPQRIKKVHEHGFHCLHEHIEPQTEEKKFTGELSGSNWNNVKAGKEYLFTFMLIELDKQKKIKKRFSGQSIDEFSDNIHNFLEDYFAEIGGKIWMWDELGGLILFPFDGKSCPAIFRAFELSLNSRVHSFEKFDYDILFSYKISIHIGSTAYHKRGHTGKIISDSINSIYHLSHNFAEENGIYLTEDVVEYRPEGFEEKFISIGEYEGREIFRMLKVESA